MKKDLVSICIPTFNGEKYLRECLNSVLDQSYENIEIVIVDDKSGDGTVSLINEYIKKDNRIVIYQNENNLGLVGNWNKCIALAKGEWIKFVFQDDYITSDCVTKMLNGVKNEDSLIACKRTFIFDDTVDSDTKAYYQKQIVSFDNMNLSSSTNFIIPEMISRMAVENICMNFIGEPTSVMFRKKLIDKIGDFNNSLTQICDLEFFLRIGTNYGITYIPESLTRFRIHALSATSSNLNAKSYTLSHIDTIITVHELLYNKQYSKFRKDSTFINKVKLQQFFAVRVSEAYKIAKSIGVDSEEMQKFNKTAQMYPEIDAVKHPTLSTRLLYKLVKWIRITK